MISFSEYQFLNHGVQIDLEAYGRDIDHQQLEGLWRLIYTTALDVVCTSLEDGLCTGHMPFGTSCGVCAVPLSCCYKCALITSGCPVKRP